MPVPRMPAQVRGRDAQEQTAGATGLAEKGGSSAWAIKTNSPSTGRTGTPTGTRFAACTVLTSPVKVEMPSISGELAQIQVDTLKAYRIAVSHRHHEEVMESSNHHHGEKRPSIFTAIPSAIINFLLMFGLCCAYGMIMFEHPWNARHRGLAVKMNLGSAMIVGLLLATRSKVNVAIGGPDLNPVVFLGMFVTSIAQDIASQLNLDYPSGDKRRLQEVCAGLWDSLDLSGEPLRRQLGGGDGAYDAEFCTGAHLAQHVDACKAYHAQLRATTIFTVAVSSLVFGVIYLCLGTLRLTRYVSYVPTNIMEAFLSCVGYKVFKYALKFCKFQLNQFVPAACVGVTLYILKANHIGNPALVIPVMLLVPLGIFYGAVYGTGSDITVEEKYMFPTMENVEFWKLWTDSVLQYEHVNFQAWLTTLADFPVMIVVVVLDCLLKLSSTENKLPVKTHKDYEMQLYGMGNILGSLTGSSVGYMQLKFNVINYGVMGNVMDRRGGAIYAILCGVCFFWTIELFNYLPRFFLGTLLFFAGAGFVAENLWGSRKYLSRIEWLQIVVILAVFIILNSLLYAVIVGGLLVGGSFIAKYANVPCIVGGPTRGGAVFSNERRELLVQKSVQHIANRWLLLIRLKGYIFFASAQSLIAFVNKALETEAGDNIPHYRRLRFVIFDCKMLDGMDSSATKAISRVVNTAHGQKVRILWSNVTSDFYEEMKPRGLLHSPNDWFEDLDAAIEFIDRLILDEMKRLEGRWVNLHPTFELIDKLATARRTYGPLSDILATDAARFGCPWQYCGRIEIRRSRTLLWRPGELARDLFLVSSGRVGLFAEIPAEEEDGLLSWSAPLAVYGHGWFLNREALHHAPTRHYAVALDDGELLFWNEHQRGWMSREQPQMASAIMNMVLRQEASDSHRLFTALSNDRAAQERGAAAGGGGDDPTRQMSTYEVDPEAEGGDMAMSSVPEELAREVRGISIARALDELGLYAPIGSRESSVLPSLPRRIREDLRIAFCTYSTAPQDAELGKAQRAAIPWGRVSDALLYAGIFNTVLCDIGCKSLSEDEFLAVGHAAAMTRLSNIQVARLEEIFRGYDTQGLGTIGSETLTVLFKETVSPTISVVDVDGVAQLWYRDGQLTSWDFVGIMSRFIRIHEADWFLLCGLRHLGVGKGVGKPGSAASDVLTADMLLAAGRGTILREEAEEMIWTADFCDGKGQGETLDFRLVAAALLSSEVTGGKLPPAPMMPEREALPTVLTCDDIEFDEVDMGGIVTELRSLVPTLDPAMHVTTRCQHTEAWVSHNTTTKEGEDIPDDDEKLEQLGCRARLYLLLEEPSSSQAANILSLVMGIMILVSVLTLVLEPLISPVDKARTPLEAGLWMGFETFFTAVFTLEFVMRLAVADAMGARTTCQFLRQPLNICDVCAVMPFYIETAINTENSEFRLLRVVRLMRLSRVMRMARLANKSQLFASIAVILTVIWGIYMKTGL